MPEHNSPLGKCPDCNLPRHSGMCAPPFESEADKQDFYRGEFVPGRWRDEGPKPIPKTQRESFRTDVEANAFQRGLMRADPTIKTIMGWDGDEYRVEWINEKQ